MNLLTLQSVPSYIFHENNLTVALNPLSIGSRTVTKQRSQHFKNILEGYYGCNIGSIPIQWREMIATMKLIELNNAAWHSSSSVAII